MAKLPKEEKERNLIFYRRWRINGEDIYGLIKEYDISYPRAYQIKKSVERKYAGVLNEKYALGLVVEKLQEKTIAPIPRRRKKLKQVKADSVRYVMRYQPWVHQTLERDGYRCIDCRVEGDIEVGLVVHHIDESRKTGKLNNELENLVTLCRSCHAKRHGITKDYKEVYKLRKGGMSFGEIGEKLGITRQRAHQLYNRYVSISKIKVDLVVRQTSFVRCFLQKSSGKTTLSDY